MKFIVMFLAGWLVVTMPALAGTASEADQRWVAAIEKLVSQGTTRFNTESQDRVELARGLATKLGRSVQVDKKDKGFALTFSGSSAKTASK